MLVKYYQIEYSRQRCRVHAHTNMPSIIAQLLEVNAKSLPLLSYGRLGGLPHRLQDSLWGHPVPDTFPHLYTFCFLIEPSPELQGMWSTAK